MFIMADYDRKVISVLKEHGFTLVRHGKGSHDIWYNPATKRTTVVGRSIKSKETANAIMKQAGISYKF